MLTGFGDEEAEEPIARIEKEAVLWNLVDPLKAIEIFGLEFKPKWVFEEKLDGNLKQLDML